MYADCLPGASVTVRVNGTPLTEHATENSDLSATTFVEAVAGAEFDVALNLEHHFAYRNPADRIEFSVYVDGAWVRTPLVKHFAYQCVVEGPEETQNGVTTLKRLTFAQHASTDNNVDQSIIKKFSDLGQIKVTLQRCREAGPSDVTKWGSHFNGVVDHAVPEKALKGRSVSSHTRLGRTERKATPNYFDVTHPYGDAPIATYVFQYRSRRDLEIEGIIERAPSPVPLIDRNPDELTPEALREQIRLLRERLPAVRIKQESKPAKRARKRSIALRKENGNAGGNDDSGDDSDDDGDVTFVSESNKRRRTRESMENAEVVDLTDD